MYTAGVVVVLVAFVIVGIIAGKSVKDTNDYYVAGRNAPVILITGSLIASFLSTGAFMGDTGEVYSGFFIGIMIVGIIQASGYVYGAHLFGKYIRRAEVKTVPEYFGKRFSSRRLRVLASVTLIFAVTAYILSAMQGISLLMTSITGLDYQICVFLSWLSFTIFTVWSGAKGVLLTDTIMFVIFLVSSLICIPYIVSYAGGWFEAISALAVSKSRPGIISWTNNLEYMYSTGTQNLIWAVVYGIVWAVVVMVSPWQTSRFLMAKDEHTVLRSSVWASIGVITVTTALYFSAVFIYKINPEIEPASTNLIWAAMNIVPFLMGLMMLAGILSAGISSASTFLSLIGSCLTNDILVDRGSLRVSRIGMFITGLIVLVLAFFNPPQIFWIMYFGGTVIASSWGIPAIASVWYKNMSESGAFWGMLLGFIGCIVPKMYSAIKGVIFPLWLDPFFIGAVMSLAGIIAGSKISPASQEDKSRYESLHIRPASEKSYVKDRKTYRLAYFYGLFGLLLGMFFVFFYAIPYMSAVKLP